MPANKPPTICKQEGDSSQMKRVALLFDFLFSMVLYESFKWRLKNRANIEAVVFGCLGDFSAIVECYASHKVDGLACECARRSKVVGDRNDIATEELLKTVHQECMNGRMVAVACAEWAE